MELRNLRWKKKWFVRLRDELTVKNPPSKDAHNRPKFCFHSIGLAAQTSPKLTFHIIDMYVAREETHLSTDLWPLFSQSFPPFVLKSVHRISKPSNISLILWSQVQKCYIALVFARIVQFFVPFFISYCHLFVCTLHYTIQRQFKR